MNPRSTFTGVFLFWKLFLTRKVIAFDADTSVAASAETETRNWFTLERAFIKDEMRLSRNRDVANDGSDDVENYDDNSRQHCKEFNCFCPWPLLALIDI